MDVLRQFTFIIVYRPGKSNQNADDLSRPAWIDDRPAQNSPEEGEMLGLPNTFGTETFEYITWLEKSVKSITFMYMIGRDN